MNLRFRRQHPIGPYIADFYCPAARLVIEVGGRTHRTPEAVEHDRRRDSWMRSQGIEVLRVTNDDIVQAVDAAAKRVVTAAAARAAQTGASGVPPPRLATDPLPKGGGVNRPIFSVLVPNEKGFDRALAVHRAGPPLKIAAFTAASETFSRKNINATIAESIDRFRAFVPRARAEGMPVRLYVSCAIACPFEGAIAPATVRGIVERLLELAPDDAARAALEIDLADTIGVAHPNDIHDLLREFDEPMRRAQITLHLHDTFARAASCVRAALDAGVRSFDASAGGLGGCPFAGTPTRRAPGNIATEILVDAVHSAGFRTNVDPDRLREASAFARSLASR
jgi:hydroxymethylglutaryl-CoA lyase